MAQGHELAQRGPQGILAFAIHFFALYRYFFSGAKDVVLIDIAVKVV